MKKEKVSIIIPVYNAEKYVKSSVESALEQDFENTEIVIVNDCSTDASKHVIFNNFSRYIDSGKIKYIENEKNSGRNITANNGVRYAQGKYIFFLDADDLWERNHVSTIVEIFQYEKPDIVYALPRRFIDENGQIKRISRKKVSSLEDLLFSSRMGFPSATAFNRNSFIFYNPDFKFREDIEILLRAYLKGQKIYIADTDSVLIREHNSPDRMSKSSNFYIYTFKLYNRYIDKIPQKYKGHFLFHISEICFKFGDFKNGYKFLKKAVVENPYILLDKRNFIRFLKRAVRLDKMVTS